MGEDDLVELLWKSDQVVRSSQAQTHSSDPPPILRGSGSGSGGGEINDPLPLPQPPSHDQNLFIQEDEMASWLHHPLSQDYFSSELLYSSAPATHHPQSSVSLPPPPTGAPYGSMFAARRTENFMNFSRLIGNIHNTGVRVEAAGPSTQVGSSATPSSSAIESCVIPATENRATATGGVSRTFAVPGLGRKEKAVAIETVHEIGGTSSSGVCKAETEPFQVQLTTETGIADDRKRKEREETMAEIKETEEAGGSTCRKRSRAAEMHNISERRRRERINEKMKALQELIPRCNKSDKASMLDDAIEYMKSLQMQIQPASPQIHLADDDVDGHGMMPPMMYAGNMQQFMPHMAMGMMGMNRPPFIPRPAHMVGRGPSYSAPRFPLPNVQTSDPSRVHLPNPQSNQPQFPAYMNPYSQFVGLHQMHQPPPLPSQTTSQMSFSQASSSKEPGDHDNQPAG